MHWKSASVYWVDPLRLFKYYNYKNANVHLTDLLLQYTVATINYGCPYLLFSDGTNSVQNPRQ